MRVGIVGGAGTVGSAFAFCLASSGLAERIVLVDTRVNVARSHAMDIEQAVCEQKRVEIVAGDYPLLADCDVVAITAGAPERSVSSRDEYLAANLAIIRPTVERILEYCPQPVLIIATNPVDVLTYVVCTETGLQRTRVIGFTRNDTLRFKWAIGRVLEVEPGSVDCLVVGEHGDNQVPLYSRIAVEGEPVDLGEQRRTVESLVKTWFHQYQDLNSGRSSGWTSGLGLTAVIGAMAAESDDIVPCSVVLKGEYGLTDVSLSVPVRLGRMGVREIVELSLTPGEANALAAAARKVRSLAEGCRR